MKELLLAFGKHQLEQQHHFPNDEWVEEVVDSFIKYELTDHLKKEINP